MTGQTTPFRDLAAGALVADASLKVHDAIEQWHAMFGTEHDDEAAFRANIASALYQAGMLRPTSIPDEVRKSAIETVASAFHAKYCVHNGAEDCISDCHDDAVLAVDTLIGTGLLHGPNMDDATVERVADAINDSFMAQAGLGSLTGAQAIQMARAALRAARGAS